MPKPGAAIETTVAYEPYRRFYLAHQGEMELAIRPLRSTARKALSGASAALGQLATLDAALEMLLATRERQLLASLSLRLEKRFERLFMAHRQQRVEQAEDPAVWMRPGGWLAAFCKELQGVLLAELDLRLQPALGLIEAFSNRAE